MLVAVKALSLPVVREHFFVFATHIQFGCIAAIELELQLAVDRRHQKIGHHHLAGFRTLRGAAARFGVNSANLF